MDITLRNAYTEVNQILNLLGKEYKEKVPEKLLNTFDKNQNINHKTNIKKDVPIQEMIISRTTFIIIGILNFKYWETDENKKIKLKNAYINNEKKLQEHFNSYENSDWLNNKKDSVILEEQETSLVLKKETSFIKKAKEVLIKLINFFKKR